MEENFFLSKIFLAHKNDVKCVLSTSASSILSSSRDGTVKLWTERAGIFKETFELRQRKNFPVNAVAFYQAPNSEWLIFAGVKDGTIEVFDSTNSVPRTTLRNHTQNVCVLFIDSERKLLLSGSWDKRAVCWSIDNILAGNVEVGHEIVHHKNSVWAAITMPDTSNFLFVTGSADRTIKLHSSNYEELFTFTGHSDVVRSLVAVSSTEFLSSSNDGTIRLWNTESRTCIQKCETVSNEFVYNLAKLEHKSGKHFIIAGMERGFVEVWRLENNSLVSICSFRIPASSVWSVAQYRNTEIVLGSSSGQIYIYTTEESKKADDDIMQNFDAEFTSLLAAELAAQESKQDEYVTIKVAIDDGAPNLELKYKKGEDPGDAAERFIKDNGLPISYYNEITDYIKANIPEARLAEAGLYKRQETQRQNHNGQKFDYVFDVKLSENGESLSLCYNIGEDPDYAAQRFVEQHDLPVKFLPQLSNYLSTQVPELAVGPGGSGEFVRIGGSVKQNGAATTTYVDPFTGSGRYVPGNSQVNGNQNTYAKTDKMRPRGDLIPIREFFRFGLENAASKTIPKLKEMNESQFEESKLSDEQVNAMSKIMSEHTFDVEDAHVSALQMVLNWSMDSIIPALDVFRVALLNEELNKTFCTISDNGDLGQQTLQRLSMLLISEPSDPVRVLVCRAFANATVHEAGRRMLMTDIAMVCKLVTKQLAIAKPNLQIAAASAIANCARLLLIETEAGSVKELGPREDVLRAIVTETESLVSFSNISPLATIRLLQAIATLMWGDATVIELAKSRDVAAITNRIKDSLSDENAKTLCRDIIGMIY